MSEEKYGEKCDYDPCHCKTNPASSVSDGKVVFCSAGCMEGRGCHHDPCNCAEEASKCSPEPAGS